VDLVRRQGGHDEVDEARVAAPERAVAAERSRAERVRDPVLIET
jgi:hypothetical protein